MYIKKLSNVVFNIVDSNLSEEWIVESIEGVEGVFACIIGYREIIKKVLACYEGNIDMFSIEVEGGLEEILLRYEELEIKRELLYQLKKKDMKDEIK